MTAKQSTEFEVKRGVAYVTLNRPEIHNAFDDEMIAALTEHFEYVGANNEIRAMVLQAKGKSFSAGANLGWMQRMVNYSEEENQRDAMGLATMLQTLFSLPKLTIARIQGAAFGGAVGLVACCDIAIATDDSQFCLSEVKFGLIPATISPYVIDAIGARSSRRYFQTAERFSATKACQLGLVSECVSSDLLDETVDNVLTHIMQTGPKAVAKAKALVNAVSGKEINTHLMQQTSQLIAAIRVSDEGQRGLQAFINKQPAPWTETAND